MSLSYPCNLKLGSILDNHTGSILTRYDGGLLGPTSFVSSHKKQRGEETYRWFVGFGAKSSVFFFFFFFFFVFEAEPIFVVSYRSRGDDYVEDTLRSGHIFGNEAFKQVIMIKEIYYPIFLHHFWRYLTSKSAYWTARSTP